MLKKKGCARLQAISGVQAPSRICLWHRSRLVGFKAILRTKRDTPTRSGNLALVRARRKLRKSMFNVHLIPSTCYITMVDPIKPMIFTPANHSPHSAFLSLFNRLHFLGRVNRQALRIIIVRIRQRLRSGVIRIRIGRLDATVRFGEITSDVVELSTRDGNARGSLEERHVNVWMS